MLQYLVTKIFAEGRAEELKFTEELDTLKEAQLINLNDTNLNFVAMQG